MTPYSRLKRFLVGKPIATKHAHHERLPKIFGLPIFASDALSSVAYATEEILLVLAAAGTVGLTFLMPVSWALGILMLIVGTSYFQTIQAYPKGGGTYLVSTENLGSFAGRVAGASLLIDYILTVAVSISSGVLAVVSAFPNMHAFAVPMAAAAILLLMLANLRGAKESGIVFAIPTYSFVLLVFLVIVAAVINPFGRAPNPMPVIPPTASEPLHAITVFLILRAFAASCTALTGTEAIADGVQAFRPPEARNAGLTLVMMVTLLMTMFLGIGWAASHYHIFPLPTGTEGYQTVLAQIGQKMFGNASFLFYALQGATALILFLAANTAYADFPRLSSFIARDGYLPRQLGSLGDRLVFQNGIILLSVLAMVLIYVFHADTHSLIPLYAVGVFLSFTLSQSGMVVKLTKEGHAGWKAWMSAIGALTTGVVTIILLVTKFEEGAWIIVVALAVILMIFKGIRSHYNYLAQQLSPSPNDRLETVKTTSILLVPRMHRGILHAIAYAQSTTRDCRAIHVTLDSKNVDEIKADWDRFGAEMPLVILESPYRSLIQPVTDYIDQALNEEPDSMITVIVPQAVPKRWWHSFLHNNIAVPLKLALASRKNVVVTNIRYFLS